MPFRKVYQKNVLSKGGLWHSNKDKQERIQPLRQKGKALELGTTMAGKKHLYAQGETLEYTYVGSHFVRKFPWRKQQDMVHVTPKGMKIY